jgi:uncharacterized tellurite resistance protein B-like protein
MARLTADDEFHIELLKLLLQLALADGRIDRREAWTVLGLARSWGIPEGEMAALKKAVDYEATPLAPDLAVLRGRSAEVFEALSALVASDGKLQAEEKAMFDELRLILGPES